MTTPILMPVNNPAESGGLRCGRGERLLLIAGPCVLETAELALQIAKRLQGICAELPVQLIFKASFDKANRTRGDSYRGPGFERGLAMLETMKDATGLPVTTDIHEPWQAPEVGKVCDLIQIPAFLARQTDLLEAAAATGKAVHGADQERYHCCEWVRLVIACVSDGAPTPCVPL